MTSQHQNHRIYEYITKSTFANFEDALEIGKLKIFAGEYTNGSGAKKTLTHFVDTHTARPLLLDMQWAKPIETKDYKGQTKSGTTTSRVLTITTKEKGYFMELTNGPGKETPTGAVTPAGRPETAVNVFLPFAQARMIAAEILEYLTAYKVAQLVKGGQVFGTTAVDAGDETVTQGDPPGTTAESGDEVDELDKYFPRDKDGNPIDPPDHNYEYQDGTAAPKNKKTRAIFQAYYNEKKEAPKDGKALEAWWNANKPK